MPTPDPNALPTPRRDAAHQQLAAFVAHSLPRYAESRNYDCGPEDHANVSTLSPFLRHRLLLEQEVLQSVLAEHSLSAIEKFVQEVFWRSYFKGWLEHRPEVWTDYRETTALLATTLDDDPELYEKYQAATAGQTGIDCFDAWTRELEHTGYLHNHARMWFASIWIFTLGLPWQLGADYFYRHLLDGDPASNTLSWRWVGGLHTKGKRYLATSQNIAHYTNNRFNPVGQLATDAPPLTETREFLAGKIPELQSLRDDEPYGLLITEEDCCPETLLLQGAPVSVLGLVAHGRRSPLPVGEHTSDFTRGAVADGLTRAALRFAVDTQLVESSDWTTVLNDWATQKGVNTIVTSYAPVGPVAEMVADAHASLRSHNIQLLQIRRRYDTLVWPHATRGFFKLKKQIPGVLHELGLQEPD
ncbi:MAG: DNA photolyase [Gammaproteobacteria bacterium]|nr:DNA photolyase [Gammaproteobacteria bacterium]